ncbi:MAG: D-amino acid aminotransferase [Halothiobacillaceae bacterium]
MNPELSPATGTVYLNGTFLPAGEARVSVLDRGFLFGDGVYEVIPFFAGRPLGLAGHLDRLARSLREIGLADPHSREEWLALLREIVSRHGAGDLSVYLQVTRGAPARRDHAFPAPQTPATVLITASPLRRLPESVRADGASAITLPDQRWGRCDIKSVNLLANVLARQQAVTAGVMEAILLREGHAVEGAASNLFVVRGDCLVTPPRSPHILAGITRALVLDLAAEVGLAAREQVIPEQELRAADEIWMTSSTREIMPVCRLDGVAVGSGRPGAAWIRLDQAYQERKRALPEDWTT